MEVGGEAASVKENAIREDLVVTAVKFLQNLKVSSSPLEMKRTFLIKKGLSEAEITEAFTRLGPMMKTVHQDNHVYAMLPQRGMLNYWNFTIILCCPSEILQGLCICPQMTFLKV